MSRDEDSPLRFAPAVIPSPPGRSLMDDIDEFSRASEVSYAGNTAASYALDLLDMARTLSARAGRALATAEITPDVLRFYLLDLMRRGRKETTIDRHRSAITSFFRFMELRHGIKNNPVDKLGRPRSTPSELPDVLTIEEARILCEFGAGATDPRSLRDRAIIETLYATGIRVGELRALRWSDVERIDRAGGVVLVRDGKGGKDRIVPIGAFALRALERWRESREPAPKADEPVFTPARERRRARITARAIEKIIIRQARAAGIKRTLTPHTFRHTCATHLLQRGAGVRDVQAMLGHANLGITARYARVDGVFLEEQAKHHPLARGA